MRELVDNLYDFTVLVIAAKHGELEPYLKPNPSAIFLEQSPVEIGLAYSRFHHELHTLVADLHRRKP